MKTFNIHSQIAELIAKDLTSVISDSEKQELESWLNAKKEHRLIYNKIKSRLENKENKSYYDSKELIKEWNKLHKTIPFKRKKKALTFIKYAAATAAIIVMGIFMYNYTDKYYSEPLNIVQAPLIPPGTNKAVLTLADGKQIILEEVQEDSISASGSFIEKKEGSLKYLENEQIVEPQLNTLYIPKGGEYKLILSDGTTVWLNSDTEITYPVKFTGKERLVMIKGEAFFDVQKNPDQPFIVKTQEDICVKVLGTQFNISAYETDASITTTVNTGKVEMGSHSRQVIIEPHYQVIFNKKEMYFSKIAVDSDTYSAWKDGKFIFDNKRLEDIMKTLARWYDVSIEYEDESVKDIRFSGDLERYKDFSTSLKMLEKVTKIKFKISETTINVFKL
ncbi:FecR family protein [Bacteroides sp. 224]|uniref:FecR family protein n=1 Tax=Bacteroides sp. 224 TaxID=2302936 RepID=UPI0013D041B2|nr:FecR domain-containing protein [Bacteroides sp. 224]NDV65408.1 FecR family protein [Bacteroides sp. 224]